MSRQPAQRLSMKLCLGFSIGTVGVSIMLNAVTAYFPAFMSTVLGQSPEIAGYLLMGSKLFDALIDVAVGTMSDRTRSRWGRRKPYLLAGGLLSAISFLLIFAPLVTAEASLVPYMIAALLIYSLAYSLFNVPYMAMPAELTNGFHERTRLLSVRTVFVSLGQLLSMAGTAALIERGGGGAAGLCHDGSGHGADHRRRDDRDGAGGAGAAWRARRAPAGICRPAASCARSWPTGRSCCCWGRRCSSSSLSPASRRPACSICSTCWGSAIPARSCWR